MSAILQLDDPSTLPEELRSRLSELDSISMEHLYVEDAETSPTWLELAEEVEREIQRATIAAYHCTREREPEYFSEHGLRPLEIQAHRSEFLAQEFGRRNAAPEEVLVRVQIERFLSARSVAG